MNFIPTHQIRARFVESMSRIYEQEVGLYGTLREAVAKSNGNAEIEIHHAAIRLASATEMRQIARLFRVMGMFPVNYYNLTASNLPVHSTAFRAINEEELAKNPFRVFVSVLRHDLIPENVREKVEEAIARRQLITPEAMRLIEKSENQGGLEEKDAEAFILEAVKTFQKNQQANVAYEFYQQLLSINSLLADVVSFKNPHINHLTIKSLHIDELQQQLNDDGIKTTPIIQGPPKRKVPILLRQGSFQAVLDEFEFPNGDGTFTKGQHRARFGEYESKGDVAVTPKGMQLYDECLRKTEENLDKKSPNYKQEYARAIAREFKNFPDDLEALRQQKLVYLKYEKSDKKVNGTLPNSWESLITQGYVTYKPLPYYDFLPVSAAGIFKSNLVEGGMVETKATEDRKEQLEQDLGSKIFSQFDLSASVEAKSILETADELGFVLPKEWGEELKGMV
jgi:uncharacterized glyoxalase superfamily metalloenzyme YdcJ